MGGGNDKKAGNALASATAQVSADQYRKDLGQRDTDIDTGRAQSGESRAGFVGATGDYAGRDYNTYNNPYAAEAAQNYRGFSETGGINDAEAASIRRNATGFIPGMYERQKQEANRASVAQGGYGPGRAALQSRLTRDQGRMMTDATVGAEANIAGMRQQGRMFGATGTGALSESASSRNMRQGEQVMGANQNLLDSDRAFLTGQTGQRDQRAGIYGATQIGAANTLKGNDKSRDWLGTALGIGSAVTSGWDWYKRHTGNNTPPVTGQPNTGQGGQQGEPRITIPVGGAVGDDGGLRGTYPPGGYSYNYPGVGYQPGYGGRSYSWG